MNVLSSSMLRVFGFPPLGISIQNMCLAAWFWLCFHVGWFCFWGRLVVSGGFAFGGVGVVVFGLESAHNHPKRPQMQNHPTPHILNGNALGIFRGAENQTPWAHSNSRGPINNFLPNWRRQR